MLWQLKHWAGLSGSSLVRGMSTIFVTELDLGVRCSLIGPLNKSHFQGSSLTALTKKWHLLKISVGPFETMSLASTEHSPRLCAASFRRNMHFEKICRRAVGINIQSFKRQHPLPRWNPSGEEIWNACRWTALQFESTFLGLTGRYNDLYSILWNIHKTIKDRTS